MKELAIIGASGHGKVIADIAKKMDMRKLFFWMIMRKFPNAEAIR